MKLKVPKSIITSINIFCIIFTTENYNKLYLPPEIIEKIYLFIIQDYYRKIIYRYCYNYINILKSIKYTIRSLIISEENDSIIEYSNIEALKYLEKSHITRKYDLQFWAYYLQILSIKINRLRFNHRCNHITLKSLEGKKFLLVLNLWLQLCKKFNLKIFLRTKKFSKYIRAKNILKMNLYDKYILPPIVIKPFTSNDFINTNEAINYLFMRLRII